jgi:hypothetical protein
MVTPEAAALRNQSRRSFALLFDRAWYSRCRRGFKMGGKAPCGFRAEPIIDGIHTKKLVIEPTEAAFAWTWPEQTKFFY